MVGKKSEGGTAQTAASSNIDLLERHQFVSDALKKAVQVQKLLNDKNLARVMPDYERDPDEHEFYIMNVATSIVDIITSYTHLEHIKYHLTSFKKTPASEALRISQCHTLTYNIENYIIRASCVYDRMLKLINAVFHLLNDPKYCTQSVILSNLKVSRTDVPKAMNIHEKIFRKYSRDRNTIVHETAYKDDKLRLLELVHISISANNLKVLTDDNRDKRLLIEWRKQLTSEIIKNKKNEFAKHNGELAKSILYVFNVLAPHYAREEHSLLKKLSKNPGN